MKPRKRAQRGAFGRRVLEIAAEIVVGLLIVVVVFLYAEHEYDPWMPRPAALKAGFWMMLGFVIVGTAIQTKLLQRKLSVLQLSHFPPFESWLVPFVLGIGAVVFGASGLSEIYRPGALPNSTGRIALVGFYALSGIVSVMWGWKLLRRGFSRNDEIPKVSLPDQKRYPVKERVLTVLPGAFLAYEGVRFLIGALIVLRG